MIEDAYAELVITLISCSPTLGYIAADKVMTTSHIFLHVVRDYTVFAASQTPSMV